MSHKQEKYGTRGFIVNMYDFCCVLISYRKKGLIIYHQSFLRACCGLDLYWGLYVY